MPRAIIGDPAEVVHFLGRQARRLAGIRDMRIPVTLPPPPKPPSAVLMAPANILPNGKDVRTLAEATFSTSARKSPPTSSASPVMVQAPAPRPPPALRAREVRNRAGRVVPVRLRRAPGQLDLPL